MMEPLVGSEGARRAVVRRVHDARPSWSSGWRRSVRRSVEMPERERKQKPAPEGARREIVEVAAPDQAGREAQGRDRRSARRDRLACSRTTPRSS